MEFLETIARQKTDDIEVDVKLITVEDEYNSEQQNNFLVEIKENIWNAGVRFTWDYDQEKTIHARRIVTDSEWKILLDRGLDVFQPFDSKDAFQLTMRHRDIDHAGLLR